MSNKSLSIDPLYLDCRSVPCKNGCKTTPQSVVIYDRGEYMATGFYCQEYVEWLRESIPDRTVQ